MSKDNVFLSKYGPWALVTGASNGIGLEMVKILAAKGMNIVLVARRREELNVIGENIQKQYGVETLIISADLSEYKDVTALNRKIEDLDIGLYIANAGFGTLGPFHDLDVATELNMIDLNCRALTELAHPLAKKMTVRGRGGMIFLSSIVAFQGVAGSTTYAASKAFVQSFAEGLAIELKPFGVDVLSSAPGPVATGFAERANMQMGSAASPMNVSIATLKALGNARTIRPGFQSKLLGYGLATLHRRIRSMILTQVMTGMTKR